MAHTSPTDSVIAGLPRLAGALAGRPSLRMVADLALEALRPLGATGAALLSVDDQGRVIDVATSGVSDGLINRLGPMLVDGSSPVLSALMRRRAIWLDNRERVAEVFPPFAALDAPWQAYAASPLVFDGVLAGAIAVPFATERRFTPTERTCIRSVYSLLTEAIARPGTNATPDDRWVPPLGPLLECIADGVLIVDIQTDRVVYANPAMATLTGIDTATITSISREELVRRTNTRWRSGQRSAAERALGGSYTSTCTIIGAGGDDHDLEIHHSDLDSNGYRMSVLIDVTSRATPTHTERTEHEALWVERDRLARDLHDGVVQSVFATSLTLAAAALRAPDHIRPHIEDAIDGLDSVVQQLRSTVFGLSRPRSTGGDAGALLRTMAAKASRSLGFEPTVSCVGDIESVNDPELLGHLVLAAREALSNIARHAHASAVDITLDVCHQSVDLIVVDNGVGFSDQQSVGDGLSNLAQRAEECHGTCSVDTAPGAGTVVRWSVPLHGSPNVLA